MSELISKTLGRYQIIEQVGAGGMATIYRAYQPSLERFVAIKVLSPFYASQPGFNERFRREARAVAGLSHPAIVQAARDQLDRLTLTSRAFHNDQMGPFLREVCELAGYQRALPMNTGAEAVETAIKAVRRWGYRVKGIPQDQAEIVVCSNNFHGRTTTVISFSSEPSTRGRSSRRRSVARPGPSDPGVKSA